METSISESTIFLLETVWNSFKKAPCDYDSRIYGYSMFYFLYLAFLMYITLFVEAFKEQL